MRKEDSRPMSEEEYRKYPHHLENKIEGGKMRKQNFMWWSVQAFLSMIVQGLGNTYIPEANNFGVVIAVLFVGAYLGDLHNLILEVK